MQAPLLKCVAYGVSEFYPHISLDSTKGGVRNDWLALAFSKYLRPGIDHTQPLEQKIDEETGVGIDRMVTLAQPTPHDEARLEAVPGKSLCGNSAIYRGRL